MAATERVIGLMERILQRDVDQDLTFDDEGGVTKLDVARLVIAIEKAFGVEVMDEVAAEWASLGEASMYVEGLIEGGETGKAIKEEGDRTGWFYS